MHLLGHDLGEFLLAITDSICLAHGETEAAPIEITGKFSRVSTLIMWRRCFATTGIRNERHSADVGCPRSRCAHSVLCTDLTYSRSGIQQKRSWLERHWTLFAAGRGAAIPEMSL